MSLTNFAQIKGLKNLRGDVDLLLKSYDAAKVVTQIAKAEGEGNYNAEELLETLKTKLDAITGASGEGQSLEALKKAIDELGNKELAGMVYNPDFDPMDLSFGPQFINGKIKLKDLPNTFSNNGIDHDNILVNTVRRGGIDIDADAYQNALDALVTKLAANKELIDAVKTLVGDKSVQDQIDEAVKNVQDILALKADQADVDKTDAAAKILDTRVKALENSATAEVQDVVELGDTQTVLPMTNEADSKEVRVYVNGAVYYEGDDFTVDRGKQEVTWTLPDFELTKAIASKVTIKYFASLGLGEEPFDPSLIQVDESKIVLTREEPEKSFNVTIPADCTLEVVPSDPEAVEVTVTEVQQ